MHLFAVSRDSMIYFSMGISTVLSAIEMNSSLLRFERKTRIVHDAVGVPWSKPNKYLWWSAREVRRNGTWLHQFINEMHYHFDSAQCEAEEREREIERANENIISSQRLVNHLNKWWLYIVAVWFMHNFDILESNVCEFCTRRPLDSISL